MRFWSKGLGRRTVELHLAKSETTKSGASLYVKGTMEEPITWDYIMPLKAGDLTDFLALLREPQVAEYLYRSPQRNHIYRRLITGSVHLIVVLLKQIWATLRGRPQPHEPTIEIPPPRQRRQPHTTATRRRLGTSARERLRVRERSEA